MCGIAGFTGGGDLGVIKRMAGSLARRGPDEEGFFELGDVFLGHRRLSIIDLKTGHQPMVSPEGKIAVVFNGEIYNFKDLKRGLENKYKFLTNSDTEVILCGYEEWGESVFEKLEGMFAIAIWDEDKKKLLLARDRIGEKPLYYSSQKDFFVFGSELKAILEHPKIGKQIDENSLVKYLSFGQVPSPNTIFKGIKKLEPADLLIYENGKISIRKYWRPNFTLNSSVHSLKEAEQLAEEKLEAAVRKMMVSDVPLGVFLSGGIDSSLVSLFAKKYDPDLKTFSIGFEEKSFDESKHAREAAGILKTNHFEKIVFPDEIGELLPKIAEITDEPFSDVSILPTFILSGFARENIKVALGGDGGDELFLGYPTFIAEKLWPFIGSAVRIFGSAFRSFNDFLPKSGGYMSLDFKIKRLLNGSGLNAVSRHQNWLSSFNRRELPGILSKKMKDSVKPDDLIDAELKNFISGVKKESDWNEIISYYLKFYLSDQVLVKVDRASMANSLEVRAPFLDKELVEFALGLPVNYRFRGLASKYLLRRIAKKYFPKSIYGREKQGFALPIGKWFKKDLREFAKINLNSLRSSGWFDDKEIDRLWSDHQRGKADNRAEIWNLVAFELWRRRWFR